MAFNVVPIFAAVILRRGNEVLLLHRSSTRSHAPNLYHLCGGHVEKGEAFSSAVIREAAEELGIIIKPEDLHFVHVFHRVSIDPVLVVLLFECLNWQGTPTNCEPDKHTDVAWFDLNQLPDNMVIPHKNAIQLIAKKIRYSEQ